MNVADTTGKTTIRHLDDAKEIYASDQQKPYISNCLATGSYDYCGYDS